jgi:hypothetical protein
MDWGFFFGVVELNQTTRFDKIGIFERGGGGVGNSRIQGL